MLKIAEAAAKETGLKVDRLMQRHKVVVWWLQHNWEKMKPILASMDPPACPAPHRGLRDKRAYWLPRDCDRDVANTAGEGESPPPGLDVDSGRNDDVLQIQGLTDDELD